MANSFLIHQFEDKPLSHYAYAIVSNGEMVVIDPARNPKPYYDFAAQHQATIIGVIETHPHADFVSSHLEIHQTTQASIYVSRLVGAQYPHTTFDEGNSLQVGNVILKAINTPGHSPDSISVILESEGAAKAVFTGDTLFIGDCGRPDLRENAGNITATRETLAKDMYYSLRNKLLVLADDVAVYPAHGAGSLCGKALSSANRSTIGAERLHNWSLQDLSEQDFITELIAEQPFIPKYFGFDVAINRQGAPSFNSNIASVLRLKSINCDKCVHDFAHDALIIDTRPHTLFKQAHLPNSINLMLGGKFETWLGSIVAPEEAFYLVAETEKQLDELIARTAKIGYESQIKGAFVLNVGTESTELIDLEDFTNNESNYTIIDIRNPSEVAQQPIFRTSLNIPLAELRERIAEIPTHQPILVHCAGGYRSAAGSSIVKNGVKQTKVLDLSDAVTSFLKQNVS